MAARRTKREPKRLPGNAGVAGGLTALGEQYLEWLRVRGYSPETVEDRRSRLGQFILWCDERGVTKAVEVTRPVVERYQRFVFYLRKANGKPLGARAQYFRLSAVRALFAYLSRRREVAFNPAAELEMPRMAKRLPKEALTAREAEAVLGRPDVATPLGVRDRAMLEVLYSTGLRRSELVALGVHDVDAERGTVRVREGKGRKERVVPIGERALVWVEKYVWEVRGGQMGGADDGRMFLSAVGEPLTPDYLTQLARRYVREAGVRKPGSCHLFRHTCATLMLEGGADIRFIQRMLGHADLATTEIYTHVSIGALKAVHDATHPGARLARARPARGEGEPEEDATRAALLEALEREGEEEAGRPEPDPPHALQPTRGR